MRALNFGTVVRCSLLPIVLIAAAPVGRADAQERPARPGPALEFAAGVLQFPDDGGMVTEGFAGGAARWYVTPRMSVGPELAYVFGERHSHLMLTGNVTYDFVAPHGGEPPAVTPFVVAGGGLFRSSEVFPLDEVFTHTEGAFTAGGGVRALVGKRIVVGAEARIGWELHVRVNGFVGVRFGK
jgi:hypothetical protein